MISVSIVGATGRMGKLTSELVAASEDLVLHSALSSTSSLDEIAGADVVVDLTRPEVSAEVAAKAISFGQKLLIGTSGWSEAKLRELEGSLSGTQAAVVVIPNFSIGSMLAQQFAQQAAKHFSQVEIIETHHRGKVDSPSGTAIRTAELISEARGGDISPVNLDSARGQVVSGVPIHSLRLDGVSARQETVFAADGEQLSLIHDVSSHHAYAAGILASIRYAASASGLTVGLDKVLG